MKQLPQELSAGLKLWVPGKYAYWKFAGVDWPMPLTVSKSYEKTIEARATTVH
jgi:hypothetical protein